MFRKVKSTTTYSLVCSGPGGSSTLQQAVVAVAPPRQPRIILSVRSTLNIGISTTITDTRAVTVSPQDSLTVVWSSEDADTCTASSPLANGSTQWIGEQPTEGEIAVGPLTASTSLTLECAGPAGNDQQTLAVTVEDTDTSALAAPGSTKVGGGVLDLLMLAYLSLIAFVLRRRTVVLTSRG